MDTIEAIQEAIQRENQYNLMRLLSAVTASFNTLNLLICISNTQRYKNEVIRQYESELITQGIQCSRVRLDTSLSLKQSLQSLVFREPELLSNKSVATVLGADELLSNNSENLEADTDRFLFSLQWTREALREFKLPIILWMDSQTADSAAKSAPDFWSWRGGVFEFQDPAAEKTIQDDPFIIQKQQLEELLSLYYEQLDGLEKALILSPTEDKVRIRQRVENLRGEIAGYEKEFSSLNLEVKSKKSWLPTFDKIAQTTTNKVLQLRNDRLKRELEQLEKEYQAVLDQLFVTLDAVNHIKLKRQLERLETRMEAIEAELNM